MPNKPVMITYEGKTKSLSEWSRAIGLPIAVLSYRLRTGWSVEKALTAPRIVRVRPSKSDAHQSDPSLLKALTALQEMHHAQHRLFTRTVRDFVRYMEQRAAEARLEVDRLVDEQKAAAAESVCRGVGNNFSKTLSDRSFPSAQETTKLEKFP